MPDRNYEGIWKLLLALGMRGIIDKQVNDALMSGNPLGDPDDRDIRHAQIKQYTNPTERVFPDSQYRPTSLTKFRDQPFKSLMDYYPDTIEMNQKLPTVDDLKNNGPYVLNQDRVFGYSPKQPLTYFDLNDDGPKLGKELGIGNGQMSLGYDPEKKKPYMSVFDSWDFKTDDKQNGEIYDGFGLLDKAGSPFNTYDRVYFEPNLDHSVPSTFKVPNTSRVGDIELKDPLKNALIKRQK